MLKKNCGFFGHQLSSFFVARVFTTKVFKSNDFWFRRQVLCVLQAVQCSIFGNKCFNFSVSVWLSQARQQMGLNTQACTPSAYQHGNALAENAIQRIRGLAGSLMHSLQLKLGVTINSNHALWAWCMRHAAWILSRFNPHQGLTASEVVYSKPCHGQVCEFGELVLGYSKTPLKRNPKWQRCYSLEKPKARRPGQFSPIYWRALILTRSVRRIKAKWVTHMAFYKQFDLFSWQYKIGSGGKVQPTKKKVIPRSVSFAAPIGPFQPSTLVDEDAEAVTAKAQEERKKLYVCEGQSRERWMRRSCLVAREYATVKRDDTFSPAKGAHTSNLLPLLHLQRQAE